MWSLLELRLRSDQTGYALALLTGALVGVTSCLYGRLPSDSAEGVLALAASFALVTVWLYQRYRTLLDQRERRLALHAALPLPLSRIAAARTLEPVAVHLAFGALAFALLFALRALVGSPGAWPAGLFLLVLALMLFTEQMQLTWSELEHRVCHYRWGKVLIWVPPMMLSALSGAFVGYQGARDLLVEWARAFFVFLISGQFTLTLLLSAVILAALNWRLFQRRRSFSR